VEYETLGGKDMVSRAKTEEVVAFIQSQLPDLDEAVFHVTDVLPSALWTWQDTTPGDEDQTVLALGATVLSKREHETALRGMLGAAYTDEIAPWGIESLNGLIWGSRFFAWDEKRTLVAALLSSFVHDRNTHTSTCLMECNTLEKCHF
jgi:hypothetical protein